jgi:hypothetical protein
MKHGKRERRSNVVLVLDFFSPSPKEIEPGNKESKTPDPCHYRVAKTRKSIFFSHETKYRCNG